MRNAVEFAHSKLASTPSSDPSGVLILLDADKDPPCRLGPRLLECAKAQRPDIAISCVIANIEYETWFVAAAESLGDFLELHGESPLPENPEQLRLGKGWIERRFKGIKYSETQDQPSMTAKMDLALCRRRSPSFDKLCRDLERMLAGKSV